MRKDVVVTLAIIWGLGITTAALANCQNLVGNWTTICWPTEGTSNAIVAIKEDGTATYSFTDTDGSKVKGTLAGKCSIDGRLFTGTWNEQRKGNPTGPFVFLFNKEYNTFQGIYSETANPNKSNDWIGMKIR